MSKTLDKDSVTWGQKQYHIALSPGEIGEYVLLPGDPARSDIVAKYLDQAELMANNREHRTFTGYYKGIKVSVTSTGLSFLIYCSGGIDPHRRQKPDSHWKQCCAGSQSENRRPDDHHRRHEKRRNIQILCT